MIAEETAAEIYSKRREFQFNGQPSSPRRRWNRRLLWKTQ